MKKTTKTFSLLIAFLLVVIMSPAKAQAYDCSTAVDKLCKAFDNMTLQVKRINSLEAFDTLDFDKAINNSGLDGVPDSCISYKLTSADKNKLIKSFNGVIDAMSDKLYNLAGGMVTRDMVNSEFKPMKEAFRNAVNSSTSLGEMMEKVENVF